MADGRGGGAITVHSNTTIIESQPDWLTVSCTDPGRIPAFRAWAHRTLEWEGAAGNKRRDVALLGYVGLSCGRVRWGARQDGDILMMSGDVAAKELDRALERGTNITRIDLAVTVRLEPEVDDLETQHYLEYLRAPNREGRRTRASLVVSDDGGSTMYLGKRTSEVMLRVYNKAVESGEARYKGTHRYELEVKGERAAITATCASQAANIAAFTQETVYGWTLARGIVPAFLSDGARRIEAGFKRRSDIDTKLAWLGEQVAPSLEWLSQVNRQDSALRALGYDPTTGRFGPIPKDNDHGDQADVGEVTS